MLGAARPTVAAEQGRQRRTTPQHRGAIGVAVSLPPAACQQGRQSAAGEGEVGGGGGGGGGSRITTDHGFSHRVHHRDSRLQQIF